MKADTYRRSIKPLYAQSNDWYQVKPGTAAVAVAETTPVEAMQIAGEVGDLTVMDPADILEMFEDYEDPECEEDTWGIL